MTLDSTLHDRLSRYLPPDLLAELPDPQALTAALRRLNSLHQAITSFLPQYIAENERILAGDYADLRPGTFMFADVSGFTALSERLQRKGGREGPEALTQVINDFFATMLEILAKSNGQLLKFAGDALLAFFPARSGEDEVPLAIRTGLRMQRAMRDKFQPIDHPLLAEWFGEHDLALTMSIGICQGNLFEAVVGNAVQRDHIIQGDLPGQAMRAEEAGERDDVIITETLHAGYGDQFETRPVGEGFYHVIDNFGDDLSDYEFVVPRRRRGQITALFDLEEQNLLEDVERQVERVDEVARFVSAEVVNRLAFRGDHIEPENRPATVIFVHFTGLADLLRDWGADELPRILGILNQYYDVMQRTIATNGGSLNRSDPYQRGVKLLITFGAPVAYPDDPERAVTTALEMNRQLDLLNARLRDELPDALQRERFITQRIGITHGMTYAGEAGWRARREYTVMGDDVNLAARLMGKGEMGQILISQRVWERVNPHFATEALEPFQLKGKSQLTQAYLVTASTASVLSMSATSDTAFVGRDLQLLTLTYALQQAKGPRRRQAFALHGEPGVGKTRMAKQVVESAEQAGFQVAWANCSFSHRRDQSIWAALVFQLLQLDQAKSESARRRLLKVRLQELGLAEHAGVFVQLLFDSETDEDEAAPDPAVATPDVAHDALSLPDSLVQFVQAYTEQVPALLVIDDAHQSDSLTRDILTRALDAVTRARLMVVVTYEPVDDFKLDIRRKVGLGDLSEDETITLAERFLGVPKIGARLAKLLWTRTNGRPLFIESLLRLLQADGCLDISATRAELQAGTSIDTLPDDVRELIISQVDRLSPEAREVLRVASVLGNGFTSQALLAVGELDNELRLELMLGELLHAQVIDMQPDGSYRFVHGLAQATVYEGLTRIQRLKLHRTAAEYWSAQPDSAQHVLAVAYHLLKGGSPLRATEVITDSARAAEDSQRYDQAIDLYTRALDLFPHDEHLRAQLTRLHEAHGHAGD